MLDDEWCERFEGLGQARCDAAHWVRVYDELIRTVRWIVADTGCADAARRLGQLQRRRAWWLENLKREDRPVSGA